MTSPRVVVYTTSWCPECHAAKKLLARRGVAFEEVDAEARWGEAFRDGLLRLTGGRTVPQVVIDGRPIGGHDSLCSLDDRGALAGLAAAL
jgi:glutaredoxin 3